MFIRMEIARTRKAHGQCALKGEPRCEKRTGTSDPVGHAERCVVGAQWRLDKTLRRGQVPAAS